MSQISTTPETSLAEGFNFDLRALIESRPMVTAASGFGKSFALRRLLEQAAPHVQILVLDPEGEFATLREKFDLLVCAPAGADAVATPETAPILARFLIENRISAVLDIYELDPEARQDFVRLFCKALVNLPKSQWGNQVLVVLDEAHIFCPEGEKTACGQAVIDLATRGRKRGMGLAVATQRLAALNKNVAAQMMNKLIGRISVDVDVKRAAAELGWSVRATADKVRELGKGEFFAFGPAFPDGIRKIKVGPVSTSHPQSGQRILEAPPKPSAKLQKLLAEQLQDLPARAAEEAQTVEQLRADVTRLRRDLQDAHRAREIIQSRPPGSDEIKAAVKAERDRVIREINDEWILISRNSADRYRTVLGDIMMAMEKDWDLVMTTAEMDKKGPKGTGKAEVREDKLLRQRPASEAVKGIVRSTEGSGATAGFEAGLKKGARDMLAQLAAIFPACASRGDLAIMVGMAKGSGTFSSYLSTLKTSGLIDSSHGGEIGATEMGWRMVSGPSIILKPRSPAEILDLWRPQLKAGARRMLEFLIELRDTAVDRDRLAGAVDMEPASGTFSSYLSKLKQNGLAVKSGRHWKAAQILIGRR